MDKKVAEKATLSASSADASPQLLAVAPPTPGNEGAAGAIETVPLSPLKVAEGETDGKLATITFRPTSPIGIDYGVANGKVSQRKHQRNLTITYVYDDYQAKDLGVKKNWKVFSVAGKVVETSAECDTAIKKAKGDGQPFKVVFNKSSAAGSQASQDSIMDAITSDFMTARPVSQRMFNHRSGISGTNNKLPGLDPIKITASQSLGSLGQLRRAGSAHSLSSAMKMSEKLAGTPRFQRDERVMGNWQGRGQWFPAIIKQIKPGGSFLVSWAADVSDSYLDSRQIRRLGDDVPVKNPSELYYLGQEHQLRWKEKNQTIYYGAQGDKVYFWKYYKDWRMGSWFQSKHTPWDVYSSFPEATVAQISASDRKQHKSVKEIKELSFNALARYAANIGIEVKFYNANRSKLLAEVLQMRRQELNVGRE